VNDTPRIPLIRLYGNLIVSIQVSLTDSLVDTLSADVTRAIERGSISGLILDLSGVDLMDSYLTRCIRDLAITARLMGVSTVLCGLRRAVVVTLVEMGLDIPGVTTALNLERALEALTRRDHVEEADEPSDGAPAFLAEGALRGEG
jgi:rsbT antagonist protein RsbS